MKKNVNGNADNGIKNFFVNLKNSDGVMKFFVPIAGFISLIWFLIRVIPNPSRAAYPCQRLAFPQASLFVIWFTGVLSSFVLALKSKKITIGLFSFFIAAALLAFCVSNFIGVKFFDYNFKLFQSNNSSISNGGGVNNNSECEPSSLVDVGFDSRQYEPTDEEVNAMVDNVIRQILGGKGLSAIIKPGDKVVIKVNIVETYRGKHGEKGRGIITDPRIVRHVAEKVREIIGYGKTADLKVVDAVQYKFDNPSIKESKTSFYRARLERDGNDEVDSNDVCYDGNADGILDGSSNAKLVNLDSIGMEDRYCTVIHEPTLGEVKVYLPKFLRTKQEAAGSDEYCDVLIGLPVFKNHGFAGMTGAIKLHYGFRYLWQTGNEGGRINHSGFGWGMGNKQLLLDYLCAQNRARKYDLVIMDCLTGNRRGPVNSDFNNPDSPVDYILTNSILCSRDSVAIDTVETLFAGYDIESVKLLSSAYLDGLGINKPEFINIIGLTDFTNQRINIYNKYHSRELYPFCNGWGGAKIMNDFKPPKDVTVSSPVLLKDNIYKFIYTADDSGKNNLGLARIDLAINGKLIKFINTDIKANGSLEIDLSSYVHQEIKYRIAAWDKALNCSVTPEYDFKIE